MEKKTRNDWIAVGLAGIVVLCWSTVATGFKLGLQHLSVAQLLFVSALVSLMVFAVLAPITGVRKVTWKSGFIGAGLGLLNPFLYYLVLFAAYDRLPAQIAQPLNCSHAIVTALIAIPILRQLPRFRVWCGLLIGYLGVSILVTQGSFTSLSFDTFGIVLALGSAVLWGLYWTMSVRYSQDPITLLLIGFAVATPVVFVYCLVFDTLPAFNATTIGFGLWMGVAEMGVAFFLWQTALKKASQVSYIAPLAYLSPAISLFFIQNVLGEDVQSMTVVGLCVLLMGIAVIHVPFSREYLKRFKLRPRG